MDLFEGSLLVAVFCTCCRIEDQMSRSLSASVCELNELFALVARFGAIRKRKVVHCTGRPHSL